MHYGKSLIPIFLDIFATINKIFILAGRLGTKKKTLWPLFMDGVQLAQGYSLFEEAVYFLPLLGYHSMKFRHFPDIS